jgi:5-methylcytosine-specific restriction endonuclease McrA
MKSCKKCDFPKVWSKDLCKNCFNKQYNSKSNIKKTYKKHTNKKFDTKELHEFMYQWWNKFGDYKHCMACNTLLPKEFSTANVDHLLPKSQYPDLAFDETNFFLVCFDCHNLKEMGYPKEKHKEAYDKIKNNLN